MNTMTTTTTEEAIVVGIGIVLWFFLAKYFYECMQETENKYLYDNGEKHECHYTYHCKVGAHHTRRECSICGKGQDLWELPNLSPTHCSYGWEDSGKFWIYNTNPNTEVL